MVLLQFLGQANRLTRWKPLVDVVEQLDLLAQPGALNILIPTSGGSLPTAQACSLVVAYARHEAPIMWGLAAEVSNGDSIAVLAPFRPVRPLPRARASH